MKRIFLFIFMAGCALVFAGCAGERSGSRVLRSRDRTIRRAESRKLHNREVRLALSDYGRRIVEMGEQNWFDLVLYPIVNGDGFAVPFRDTVPEIEWMSHFESLLELEAKTEIGTGIVYQDKQEARMALVKYLTEKISPVKASLKIVREGRQFLLGDYLDSHIRGFEVRRYGSGVGLVYKKDF